MECAIGLTVGGALEMQLLVLLWAYLILFPTRTFVKNAYFSETSCIYHPTEWLLLEFCKAIWAIKKLACCCYQVAKN